MSVKNKFFDNRIFQILILGILAIPALFAVNSPAFISSDKEALNIPDPLMGDYQGTLYIGETEKNICAQVIAYGDGNYQINFLSQFDSREPRMAAISATKTSDKVTFSGYPESGSFNADLWEFSLDASGISGIVRNKNQHKFQLKKIVRLSPALGLQPPENAVILFNGKNMEGWASKKFGGFLGLFKKDYSRWQVKDGIMEVVPGTGSSYTKKNFRNFKLHIEFRTPFMPFEEGQGRGNSGVYLLEKYEVQVLDSYGLEGKDNECGGIYKVASPRVNMCAPPLQWQTYDITFFAPVFNEAGDKVKNARISVDHNGVTIHENLEIPGPTGGARFRDEKKPGGLLLQDHSDPVQYRNIWLVEIDS